ncbi:hypothetical protein M2163_000846 [Streptomyces sp. SAI-135]|jgi:hypothetical protein|nr:hypothetical protein [Streptomyces sp. SAI-090]MDH6554267.1 hypothetical protein [Streptomyces sp. SAI-041]MDH6573528.1 hypothetical protein [Streptomyces sp. SAI-117]MDH6581735.1 hypothetical protein [Streptomyces sp. SAI-133]MDH6613738.1 hypothetical protein [Streptomyces sp. SAI-135]
MVYARAHLVAALEAVLIHPPSQGRKIVGSFLRQVVDPMVRPGAGRAAPPPIPPLTLWLQR